MDKKEAIETLFLPGTSKSPADLDAATAALSGLPMIDDALSGAINQDAYYAYTDFCEDKADWLKGKEKDPEHANLQKLLDTSRVASGPTAVSPDPTVGTRPKVVSGIHPSVFAKAAAATAAATPTTFNVDDLDGAGDGGGGDQGRGGRGGGDRIDRKESKQEKRRKKLENDSRAVRIEREALRLKAEKPKTQTCRLPREFAWILQDKTYLDWLTKLLEARRVQRAAGDALAVLTAGRELGKIRKRIDTAIDKAKAGRFAVYSYLRRAHKAIERGDDVDRKDWFDGNFVTGHWQEQTKVDKEKFLPMSSGNNQGGKKGNRSGNNEGRGGSSRSKNQRRDS